MNSCDYIKHFTVTAAAEQLWFDQGQLGQGQATSYHPYACGNIVLRMFMAIVEVEKDSMSVWTPFSSF